MPRTRSTSSTPESTLPVLDETTPAPAQPEKKVTFARAAPPDPAEADALARAQAGDHHAFAHLYSIAQKTHLLFVSAHGG